MLDTQSIDRDIDRLAFLHIHNLDPLDHDAFATHVTRHTFILKNTTWEFSAPD